MHRVHYLVATVFENDPTAHTVQLDYAELDAYFPAGHAVQFGDPTSFE
jgi:hypothetical protein